jgi:arylsulfatase A-like enzyme
MTFFEGGIRSPFFLRWPAQLPAGATFAAPVAHVDIFATAAAAAGAPLPADRAMDGVNLLPFLGGKKNEPPHAALFWRSGHYRTVLSDGWKLQVSERPPRQWLFHVAEDPTERVDLSAKNPDKQRQLNALLTAHDAEMVNPAWPSLIEGPIAIDHPLGVADSASDEYVYWDN